MRTTLCHAASLWRAPRAALACPVCFGQSDSPLAKAINMGILALLVVVVGVLGGFAGFFVYLSPARAARRDAGDRVEPRASQTSDPQEGTAQC